jgi:glycosyltransferase involved in cell wall biosynthesis
MADAEVRAGVHLLVLTRYSRTGASSRVRFLQFVEDLRRDGSSDISFTVSPLLDDTYIETLYREGRRNKRYLVQRYLARMIELLGCARYDGLWIEKELFPGLPAWVEQVLSALGIRMIVDYDDATFVYYKLNPSSIIRRFMSNKIEAVCRCATVVTTGNRHLSNFAALAGSREVVEMPSVVDHRRYEDAAKLRKSNEALTIGWIGSPSTAPYLGLFAGALSAAQKKHGARVMTIGAPDYELDGVELDARPWSEATEASLVADWDIALAPLPEGEFERGKCSFKVIQCMAARVPVIASPYGANLDIIEHGINGYHASNSDEAISLIDTLMHDKSLRQKIGLSGQQTVQRHYSVRAIAPVLTATLHRAMRQESRDTAIRPAPWRSAIRPY